jgi:large subunit ribosomal protein L24
VRDGKKYPKSLQELFKMKKKYSPKWRASKQVRKKRKFLANAPLHIRHKILSSNLSKELRKSQKKRSLPLRKGDTVKIMRGKFKKKAGKIKAISLQKLKASIEGIQIQKKDGSKVDLWFPSSNLQITSLNLNDSRRFSKKEKKPKQENGKKVEEKEIKEPAKKNLKNKKAKDKNA